MINKSTYSLQFIIGLTVFISVFLTGLFIIVSALQVNRTSLTQTYLENNYQYAKKLASNTGDLLITMQDSIDAIASKASYQDLTEDDLNNWLTANQQYFNSIFIANASREIQEISPSTNGVSKGTQLTSYASKQAVVMKRPLISEPYRSISNRIIILISAPIFNKERDFIGFVGGTIYLEENNVLSRMLKDHFYGNGSYVYVVDKNGRLIFHPDTNRLGESVIMNEAIQNALKGKSGYAQITNSKSMEYFAGYAYEKISGWGIVSQSPISLIEDPLHDWLIRIIQIAIPFLLIILLIAWLVAKHISSPLYQLAKFSDEVGSRGHSDAQIPHINSKIYEVQQLYQSTKLAVTKVNQHLSHLQAEVKTDGLTRLANRNTFDQAIHDWIHKKTPFSLILLDIDHFKQINDSFGHLIGDEIIKLVSKIMVTHSREEDLCFRYGGEEFGILIHDEDVQLAFHIAERIRTAVTSMDNLTGNKITISLGIANFPQHAIHPRDLIAFADHALYQSKANERNRTTIYKD